MTLRILLKFETWVVPITSNHLQYINNFFLVVVFKNTHVICIDIWHVIDDDVRIKFHATNQKRSNGICIEEFPMLIAYISQNKDMTHELNELS